MCEPQDDNVTIFFYGRSKLEKSFFLILQLKIWVVEKNNVSKERFREFGIL